MFKSIIFASLAVSAVAFSPAAVSRASVARVSMSAEGLVGSTEPAGFFDPLGRIKHDETLVLEAFARHLNLP